MFTKLAIGLALIGPHPALTEQIAERDALMYAGGGYSVHCRVRRRAAVCVVKAKWVDWQAEVIVRTRWIVRLRLGRDGIVRPVAHF